MVNLKLHGNNTVSNYPKAISNCPIGKWLSAPIDVRTTVTSTVTRK